MTILANQEILTRAGGAVVLAAVISGWATYLVIRVAGRLGWADDPKKKRRAGNVVHEYPVPRGGGLPVLMAILAGVWLFLPLDKHVWGIVLGCGLTVVVGLVDDLVDLSPGVRLLANFLAAGLVVASGVGIAFLTNPLGGGVIDLSWPRFGFWLWGGQRSIWVLSDMFALFWMVGMMNVVGWSAGVDGQLPGVVVVAALVIGFLSLQFGADVAQWPVIILAALVAGAYLGFLPWNVYPQKIMPGYSGKSLAGFLLGVMAILSTAKVGTMMVVLGVPVVDGVVTVVRRLLSGKPPWWGDRGHLHHLLLDRGWSKRKIAGAYWVVTAALGGLALQLNSEQKFYTMVMMGLGVGGLVVWLSLSKGSSRAFGQGSG